MQHQLGGWVVDVMAMVFRIVAAIKSKRSLADLAVDVFHFVGIFYVGEDDYSILDKLASETCGLAQEAVDDAGVALGQHRGDRIVLG